MEDIKTYPHNLESEKSILGAILVDGERQGDILSEIKGEDFFFENHKEIAGCMLELYSARKVVDFVTLTDQLDVKGKLEIVGGFDYIQNIANFVPSSANYKHYLEIVKRDSLRRKLISAGNKIIEEAYKNQEAQTVLNYAEKVVFDLSLTEEKKQLTELSSFFDEAVEIFDRCQIDGGDAAGIPTGYRVMDDVLNGLHRSDLILLAARPGEGKTTFAMNIVEHVALNGNVCAVFSLEMPKIQLSQRMLCSNAKVKLSAARKGELDVSDWKRLNNSKEVLKNAKIYVDDTSNVTPGEMLSKLRRLKSKEKRLDLVVIDYIQLMSYGGKRTENRQQEVADISRSLKLIARELDVPLITLSQLSRDLEKRDPRIPQLSDLRDSGAIEQDADIIMFIHDPLKEDPKQKDQESKSGPRVIKIAKHRNGEIKDVSLGWEREISRFTNEVPEVVGKQIVPKKKQADAVLEQLAPTNHAPDDPFVPASQSDEIAANVEHIQENKTEPIDKEMGSDGSQTQSQDQPTVPTAEFFDDADF